MYKIRSTAQLLVDRRQKTKFHANAFSWYALSQKSRSACNQLFGHNRLLYIPCFWTIQNLIQLPTFNKLPTVRVCMSHTLRRVMLNSNSGIGELYTVIPRLLPQRESFEGENVNGSSKGRAGRSQ